MEPVQVSVQVPVQIYGADHSPWVQAVLLGLHEKKREYSLSSLPSLSLFFRSGVMMPAAMFGAEPWQLDSGKILKQLGFDDISKEDAVNIVKTWRGVHHRPDNPIKFFQGFSCIREHHPSWVIRVIRHFFRPFLTIYFFTLLKVLILTGRLKDPKSFAQQFAYWNKELEQKETEYFGGDSPGAVDLQLFGIIQCHCSIPHRPLIDTIQSDDALTGYREWIGRMQERFSEFPHIYSGEFFSPNSPQPEKAGFAERLAFYMGTLSMVVFFPLTILFFIAALLFRRES